MKFIYSSLVCFSIVLLTSCDTVHEAFIQNNTDNIITISVSGKAFPNSPNFKLIQEQNNSFVYEMNPQTTESIILSINQSITTENIPYQKLLITSNTKTIALNSPQEIFDAMEEIEGNALSIVID